MVPFITMELLTSFLKNQKTWKKRVFSSLFLYENRKDLSSEKKYCIISFVCKTWGGTMKDNVKKTYAIVLILIIIVLITACAPESELEPPDTSIEQMQSVYGQSGIKIMLSGMDDKTPVEKLTYHYYFYIKDQNSDREDEEQLFLEGDSETSEL